MTENIRREEELLLLNEKYNSGIFEFGYLYGQRRIGKTTLMHMFAEGKKNLMLYATDSEDIDIRDDFSRELLKKTDMPSSIVFRDWFSFFEAVDNYFGDEKGIMIIDEYPNIVLTRDGKRKKTDFQSSLQKAIDLLFKKRQFTLILTGSNVSFIEKEIGDNKAPLYERNTFSLSLKKFKWDEAVEALSGVEDNLEKAKILALTNTFPYYLSLINPQKTLDENIDDLFFKKTATFIDDPSKLITTDIATGGLYASILKHISNGTNTPKDLCDALKTDSSKMNKYLKELQANGVLARRQNFNSSSVTYYICDPMLAFYSRFIRERTEKIKLGYGALIKAELKNAIEDFIHRAFEYEALTYLESLNMKGLLSCWYQDFYNFKIDNSDLSRSIEIDVVGANDKNLLIGECKLTLQKRKKKDYFDMKEDASSVCFSKYKNKEYYLFGTSGFDDELMAIKDNNLHLIDLDAMFNK